MFQCEKHNRTFAMTGDCPECSGEYEADLTKTVETLWLLSEEPCDCETNTCSCIERGVAILKALVERHR